MNNINKYIIKKLSAQLKLSGAALQMTHDNGLRAKALAALQDVSDYYCSIADHLLGGFDKSSYYGKPQKENLPEVPDVLPRPVVDQLYKIFDLSPKKLVYFICNESLKSVFNKDYDIKSAGATPDQAANSALHEVEHVVFDPSFDFTSNATKYKTRLESWFDEFIITKINTENGWAELNSVTPNRILSLLKSSVVPASRYSYDPESHENDPEYIFERLRKEPMRDPHKVRSFRKAVSNVFRLYKKFVSEYPAVGIYWNSRGFQLKEIRDGEYYGALEKLNINAAATFLDSFKYDNKHMSDKQEEKLPQVYRNIISKCMAYKKNLQDRIAGALPPDISRFDPKK
jgi:hypothetical protein